MKTIDWQNAKRLFLALMVAAMAACAWFSPLETSANQTVDESLKRALISFATARALNAIISVAQGTEIAVQPAGVGVIFSPGQVLDPVNDLVEQFSNLMLAASIAFGIERVLINIGAHWLVSLFLTLFAMIWAAVFLSQQSAPGWLTRLLIVLLMARFALPVVVISSDMLFQHFMETEYRESQSGIESVSGQLDKLNPPAPVAAEDPGLIDKFKVWASQQTDIKARYAQLKQAAEQATERIIKLMVIFLLQTLVLPITLLWALWGVIRRIFEMSPVSASLLTSK